MEGAHASPPFFFFLLLERLVARLRRRIGEPHRHAVGQPQIDRDDVARQQLFVAIERHQPVERLLDIGFRQAHVDAVVEPQVPAPLGDQDRGAHMPRISG